MEHFHGRVQTMFKQPARQCCVKCADVECVAGSLERYAITLAGEVSGFPQRAQRPRCSVNGERYVTSKPLPFHWPSKCSSISFAVNIGKKCCFTLLISSQANHMRYICHAHQAYIYGARCKSRHSLWFDVPLSPKGPAWHSPFRAQR